MSCHLRTACPNLTNFNQRHKLVSTMAPCLFNSHIMLVIHNFNLCHQLRCQTSSIMPITIHTHSFSCHKKWSITNPWPYPIWSMLAAFSPHLDNTLRSKSPLYGSKVRPVALERQTTWGQLFIKLSRVTNNPIKIQEKPKSIQRPRTW